MPNAQLQNQCAATQDCPKGAEEMKNTNGNGNINSANGKLTILYQRLSKDDANPTDGASLSIQNQRDMLIKYAEQNGFTPYICLADDGRTGTNFERPGWAELMELVEADKVGAIILKSLDRMGRNYLEAGALRETFSDRGIRLIAINLNSRVFSHHKTREFPVCFVFLIIYYHKVLYEEK